MANRGRFVVLEGIDGSGTTTQVARLAGYIAFDQDEVWVTIGKGTYTGVRH